MARGRLTVAACGCAVLLAGCAPQVPSTVPHVAATSPRVAFAEESEPPDTPAKAKVVFESVKTDPALASLEIPSFASVRCPAEMALVEDRVCVDRWEGTIVERAGAGRTARA